MMRPGIRQEAIMARGISHRDVTKEHYWREQLAGQPGSGLSVRAYCRRHRLRESAVYFWRKELARRGGSTATCAAAAEHAAEAALPASRRIGGWIEIVLSGGRQVRLLGPVDRQSLADVL